MSMVVFVSHAPVALLAKAGTGHPFASNCDFARLARFCGMSSTAHLRQRCWVTWLTDDTTADTVVLTNRARDVAHQLMGRRVILLGMKVTVAFGLYELPPLQWSSAVVYGSRFSVARCPHPSVVNNWWSDPNNCDLARVFLSEAVWR